MNCGCGGQCGNCGLMSGLLGALLPAGSQVKVGFEISRPSNFGSVNPDTASGDIGGCVYASGGFNDVQVSYERGEFHDYITVLVTTFNEHGDIEDVGNWIQGILQDCLPDISITRRDPTVLYSSPSGAPQSGKCPQGYYDAGGWFSVDCRPLPPQGAPPEHCDWKTSKSVGDYLACQFGISTEKAVLIGAGLAVVAAVVIGKALR